MSEQPAWQRQIERANGEAFSVEENFPMLLYFYKACIETFRHEVTVAIRVVTERKCIGRAPRHGAALR